MVEYFTSYRKEKKEIRQELEFWDLVFFARELKEWPEAYSDKYWKERIFYRKLIKAIPELRGFETGWEKIRHRVTHNNNILQIIAAKNSKAEEESIMEEDSAPGLISLFQGFRLLLKEVKSLIKSIFRNKEVRQIIYFKEKGDVRLELSNDYMKKKYGIVINHMQQRAKVLYKSLTSPKSSDKRDPAVYERASIEELSYFPGTVRNS